ncbi:MAG: AAA family ATPase [bacterium]
MVNPQPINVGEKVELKLGIKSSLPKVKNLLALLYVLWKINDKQTELNFCTEYTEDNKIRIKLNSDLKNNIKVFFNEQLNKADIEVNELNQILDDNPLLSKQLEPLKVGLELIYKLATINFVNDMADSSERTGGERYEKKLIYTKNIDLIDIVINKNMDEYKNVLFNWITGLEIENNENSQNDLIKILTILSEEAIYRLRISEEEDIVFINSGIYSQLLDGNDEVNVNGIKAAGSLRILKTILKENLNFYLKKDGSSAILKKESLQRDLEEYNKRVSNYFDLININLDEIDVEDGNEEPKTYDTEIEKPHNRIIYGAPGTGKSHTLEQQRKIFGENFSRVTFHPEYSYAQFVGTYKPKPIYKEHAISSRFSETRYVKEEIYKVNKSDEETYNKLYPIYNEPHILYEYEPGPFLKLLVEAYKGEQEGKNYLLIIEEINRANVSSVFGDIFQLLDRDENGKSKYTINIPESMKTYLSKEGLSQEELYIPANLYIWATMNSADQGVFPMDTAFKRRWNFKYLDINNDEDDNENEVYIDSIGLVSWNDFRHAINKKLINLGVREDKLIGPFFIEEKVLLSEDKFEDAFKNKLLMYLYEDVLRHERKGEFFIKEAKTFNELINSNVGYFSFPIEDELTIIE